MDKLYLYCPICGREMKRGKTLEHGYDYTCDTGHEKIKVEFTMTGFPYVFLGEGCYIALDDNTSCEKAIGRMKREYIETNGWLFDNTVV